MISLVTQRVKISVDVRFLPDVLIPGGGPFVFSYRITIQNQNDFSIRLTRRHWYIFDSAISYREVEGEGVVGQQPLIKPGDSYSYTSSCDLFSSKGEMYGYYTMEKPESGALFHVEIPRFRMEVPYSLN